MNMAAPYAPTSPMEPRAIPAVVPICAPVCSLDVLPAPNASLESVEVLVGLEPSDVVVPLPSKVEPMMISIDGLIWFVMLKMRRSGLVYKPEEGILWSNLSCSTSFVGM